MANAYNCKTLWCRWKDAQYNVELCLCILGLQFLDTRACLNDKHVVQFHSICPLTLFFSIQQCEKHSARFEQDLSEYSEPRATSFLI